MNNTVIVSNLGEIRILWRFALHDVSESFGIRVNLVVGVCLLQGLNLSMPYSSLLCPIPAHGLAFGRCSVNVY